MGKKCRELEIKLWNFPFKMASTEEGCQEFGTLDLDILEWNHCWLLRLKNFQMLLMIAMHEVNFIFYAGIPL